MTLPTQREKKGQGWQGGGRALGKERQSWTSSLLPSLQFPNLLDGSYSLQDCRGNEQSQSNTSHAGRGNYIQQRRSNVSIEAGGKGRPRSSYPKWSPQQPFPCAPPIYPVPVPRLSRACVSTQALALITLIQHRRKGRSISVPRPGQTS